MVCCYIAKYPVIRTAEIALHLTPGKHGFSVKHSATLQLLLEDNRLTCMHHQALICTAE